MKLLAFYTALFVLLMPSVSFAEEQMVRGQLEQTKKLPAYTDKELEEALKISDDCKAYDRTNTRYDCDCVGMKFLDLRRQQGEKASFYWLRETAPNARMPPPWRVKFIPNVCNGHPHNAGMIIRNFAPVTDQALPKSSARIQLMMLQYLTSKQCKR